MWRGRRGNVFRVVGVIEITSRVFCSLCVLIVNVVCVAVNLGTCSRMYGSIWVGLCVSLLVGVVFGAEFTLPGRCPDVKLQKKLDYTKFSGVWYTVANFASDGRQTPDCSTMDFQEDNMGYTLRESYVDLDQGNRTQKGYFARVDPTFDAGDDAKFIVSYDDNDKVLQFPFYILSTDYDNYAIAYTCKTLKKKVRTHYAFAWVLSRDKMKLEGGKQRLVDDALSKYPELTEHRASFVFKDFSDQSCAFQKKFETDFFTNNFW